jgi:hypothetical protein
MYIFHMTVSPNPFLTSVLYTFQFHIHVAPANGKGLLYCAHDYHFYATRCVCIIVSKFGFPKFLCIIITVYFINNKYT